MLDYEEFKKAVVACIMPFLPDGFTDAGYLPEITSEPYARLSLQGLPCGPSVCLEGLFTEYRQHGDMKLALYQVAESFMGEYGRGLGKPACRSCPLKESRRASEHRAGRIVFRLLNKEGSRSLLRGVPHRDFLDLAAVYYAMEGDGSSPDDFLLVSHGKAEEMGMGEEQLYQAACRDTEKLMQFRTVTMAEVLEKAHVPAVHSDAGFPMFILTGRNGKYGSSCMLFANRLFAPVAQKLRSDLYILPSSVHEVILIPAALDGFKPQSVRDLKDIVMEINRQPQLLEKNEVLSDSVYRYSPNSGITIAS